MAATNAVNMAASSEYLPASAAVQQELVLLHGWAGDRELWRPLLTCLRPWANITLLDIHADPGSPATAAAVSLDETLEGILARSPAQAVYVGFSLGGKLALELAGRAPERVAGVITLCANPGFVAMDDWPGMPPAQFVGFRDGVTEDVALAVKRFDALQVRGSARERALLRGLRRSRCDASPPGQSDGLLAGLDWLAQLDQRSLVAGLAQPQCHLFAGADALVPETVAKRLGALLPEGCVKAFETGCHLLPVEQPQAVGVAMREFLAREGLLRESRGAPREVSKTDVADSFSRAARHYDSVAALQRDVGQRLLSRLDCSVAEPSLILDLGCGTGYFASHLQQRFPGATLVGLDIAQGMVGYARERCGAGPQWLVGDAEDIPLATGSVDLVYSSLAFQWSARPQCLFSEINRVLAPGGKCVFTSLGPDTLRELRAAWAAVDTYQHVNAFLAADVLEDAARAAPGLELALDSEYVVMHYQRVRELLDELKALGAHNMNRARQPGLTSRRALQGMLQAYESWRQAGRLPATYEVFYGVLQKA